MSTNWDLFLNFCPIWSPSSYSSYNSLIVSSTNVDTFILLSWSLNLHNVSFYLFSPCISLSFEFSLLPYRIFFIKIGPGSFWNACHPSSCPGSIFSIASSPNSFIIIFVAFISAAGSWLKWLATFVMLKILPYFSLLSTWASV